MRAFYALQAATRWFTAQRIDTGFPTCSIRHAADHGRSGGEPSDRGTTRAMDSNECHEFNFSLVTCHSRDLASGLLRKCPFYRRRTSQNHRRRQVKCVDEDSTRRKSAKCRECGVLPRTSETVRGPSLFLGQKANSNTRPRTMLSRTCTASTSARCRQQRARRQRPTRRPLTTRAVRHRGLHKPQWAG